MKKLGIVGGVAWPSTIDYFSEVLSGFGIDAYAPRLASERAEVFALVCELYVDRSDTRHAQHAGD